MDGVQSLELCRCPILERPFNAEPWLSDPTFDKHGKDMKIRCLGLSNMASLRGALLQLSRFFFDMKGFIQDVTFKRLA